MPVVQVKLILWLVSGYAPAGFGPRAPGTLANLHSLPQSCDSAVLALCTVLKKKMEVESTLPPQDHLACGLSVCLQKAGGRRFTGNVWHEHSKAVEAV